MLRIGLNGFGRIGRALARIATERRDLQLVAVNEIDRDLNNLAYLLKYDSLYGRLEKHVAADPERGCLQIDGTPIRFFACPNPLDVAWADFDLDVLVDATGVDSNAHAAHQLIRQGVPKVVITRAHPAVHTTIVLGVNEGDYAIERHHVVSSSICDANAIAPVLSELEKHWGIESCFVTTLHPWLAYQNLLDGTVASVASPGHTWSDYSLGRASALSLIPKDTTAAEATLAVLPSLAGKLDAISFRVPTHIVSASDLSVQLSTPVTADEINAHFFNRARDYPRVFGFEEDHLVSIDYLRTSQSVTVDGRRTKVLNGRMLKMVAWYDNEWGYSNRVLDLAEMVATARSEAVLEHVYAL